MSAAHQGTRRHTIRVTFVRGVRVDRAADDTTSVCRDQVRIPYVAAGLSGGVVLERLLQGLEEAELDTLLAGGEVDDAAVFYSQFETWTRLGLLTFDLVADGTTLARLGPGSPRGQMPQPSRSDRFHLSHLAYARAVEPGFVLASPLAAASVSLEPALGGRLMAALCRPSTVVELAERLDLPPDAVTLLLGMLRDAGLLERSDEKTGASSVPYWSFHDLVFHAATRHWTFGFAHAGERAPAPVCRAAPDGLSLPLFTPDLPERERTDPAFVRVAETRASIRRHGKAPITAAQLGEFLYRSARLKRVCAGGAPDERYQVSRRPYPSAGACFPLEVYAGVVHCAGIDRGLYHYDPAGHRLTRLSIVQDDLIGLADRAGAMTGQALRPQIFLVLTARVARTSWKYGSLGYALVLRDLGAFQQTLHLTATAMGLAGCPLGLAPGSFNALVGCDPLEEPALGQFLLGTLPETD